MLIIFRNPKITSLILHIQFFTRVVLTTGIRTYLAVQGIDSMLLVRGAWVQFFSQGTRIPHAVELNRKNGSGFLPVPITAADSPLHLLPDLLKHMNWIPAPSTPAVRITNTFHTAVSTWFHLYIGWRYLNFKQVFEAVDRSLLLEILPPLGFHDSGHPILVSLADSSSSSA